MIGAAITGAYVGVLLLLGALGLHRLYLLGIHLRYRSRQRPEPAPPADWPRVVVQLPVYNELHVVDRLLSAVAELEYPRDRLEIQVLDDSTDRTTEIVARGVEALRRAGWRASHLQRRARHGFKAGALAAGMEQSAGEFLCVFDADFVPPADFLRRTVPHFADPAVGMVQARWAHLNADESLLTRVQAMWLDGHFAIEQTARYWSGSFFNFNGTAGVWRRRAIADAGGWQHDTLTEDLDLSYRAQLAGWRFVYLDSITAAAQLPRTIGALKSQQGRWTRGAVQTARKLLPRIWRAPIPLRARLEATFHLSANVAYVLMVALAALVIPATLVHGAWWVAWVEMPVLLLGTGSVATFFLAARRRVGGSMIAAAATLPALMTLGAGIALSNTVAVVGGLRSSAGEFVRTPKVPPIREASPAYRSALGPWPAVEAGMALVFGIALIAALPLAAWTSVPVLALFCSGYGWVAGFSALEALAATPVSAVPEPVS